MTPEEITALDAIGMVWDVPDYLWEQNYSAAVRYHRANGHLNVPADYVVNGVWLRRWLSEQKARLNGKPTGRSKTVKELTPEQIQQLGTVGIKQQNAGLEIA